MIKSEKKLAELGKALKEGRSTDIQGIVKNLRDAEPFEGALKLLAMFYDRSSDESLKHVISLFFNDMKERSGRQEVIDSVRAVSSQSTKAMLISSCWQSGLDYSEYALTIGGVFIEGDYMTSLECFTVLDTCSLMIAESDKSQIIDMLQAVIDSFATDKQKLARELIKLLSD